MLTIQMSRFTDGGYVIHKITGQFQGRCSAWFDAAGNVLDVEHYIRPYGSVTRGVKRGGPIWRHCAAVGARYRVAASVVQPLEPVGHPARAEFIRNITSKRDA